MIVQSKVQDTVFYTDTEDQCLGECIRQGEFVGLADVKFASYLLSVANPKWQPKYFIDVGANIGTHTLSALKLGFSEVLSIEPMQENFDLLQRNVFANGKQDNVTALRMAASQSRAIMQLEMSPFNKGDNRIKCSTWECIDLHHEFNWYVAAITTERLENLSWIRERLDKDMNRNNTLIWIDTQGHEPHVFAGAHNLLKKRIPMVAEFWPYGLHRGGMAFNDYWHFIQERKVVAFTESLNKVNVPMLRAFFDEALRTEGNGYSPHKDLLII
jgi:FkbM family methyltransferase